MLLPNEDALENYPFAEVSVYARTLLTLRSVMLKSEIRTRIVISCRGELGFKEDDFVFDKRYKNRIHAPSVALGFSYDYVQIKTLAGQGKIYTRLKRLPPINRNLDKVFSIYTHLV